MFQGSQWSEAGFMKAKMSNSWMKEHVLAPQGHTEGHSRMKQVQGLFSDLNNILD